MKISYNPKSSQAAITQQTAANDDIIFDLYASKLWAKGTRIGADWADISSKPSSLKNPHALTISLNGTSQGPYDGSAAKNINITPDSIGAATSGHNHDGRYVRKWTGAYGGANKFLKLVIGEEKGWIRLEVSDSNNALSGGYGIYIIGWGYHGDNDTDTLTVRCLYANDSRYTTALKVVRTSRNNYDFYFQFASDASYPSYTINYSNSITSIDYTVTAISTIPTATWTSSLSALQLNASQVDWSGITNKPSEFNPAAHTHTVFKNNLMIKGTNGISDSASIHLGIGDSDTGFKWISDGKCQIYANNSAVGEWTSGGMNWFKNPTVNGNKVWNAGNDGSGSGLDADTLDGYHENSFLRYRGTTSTDQEATLWNQIGIKTYLDTLPDGLTGVYNYGSVISLPGNGSRFEIYASHQSSSGNGLYYRSGWNSDKKSWLKFIDSSNIGSQTVASANKLTTARKIWGQSFDGTADISGTLSGVAHIQFSADNTYNIGSNSAASKYIYTYWLGAKSGQKLELGANNSGYGQGLCIDTNLNVGIGTNTPTYKLHVNGTFRATNSTVSDLFVNTGDATLKIYTGITTDAQNDGNICFQTSIDATDGQSHAYPTQHQNRCNIVLQPRGGQVYIGTNPGTGNTTYKLYVNSKIFSNGGFVKNGSSDSYVLLGGGGHKAVSDFATASSLNNYVTTNTAQTISGVKTFSTQQKFTVGNGTAPFTVSSNTLVTNLNADLLDGVHLIKNGNGTGIKQVYYFSTQGGNSSYIKLGTLPSVSATGASSSKVMFTVKGGINFGGTNESVYEVAASTRSSIQVTSTLVRGNRELKFGYVSTSSNVEIWMAYDGTYRGVTEVEVSSSISFTLAMTETTTKPSGFVEGSYRILAATADNVASATKLQTPRTIWGNSFDGTKDINGSIVFPAIEDTATSNKISWSSSSDGADIYYQTIAKDQGNLVLNVKDDTNAYIQLALNGTFKSHFDVANSYWTGRSAQADKWTTARTFTIGNTAKNVDGSGNVSWSLSEIGVKDTWRTVQVNGTSIGNNTLNLCGSTYIGLTNVNGKVTFSLVGSGTTANQAILSNGTANGWTLKTLNIANWDAAYNFVSTITGQDADKVINKWEEIVNFLAGITEDNKLNTLLNSKLSIQQLSAKEILTTKTNNALFWVNTKDTASSITTGPFTDHPYALLSVTNYNQNAENNKFFYRSRLAFSSAGDIKVASCHHENEYKQDETWYNVLTSKNSGINGSTIKLNGTSITVYSSSTADGRYVKKTGDTMTGTLNFANNTWNQVGDDAAIGDHNVAGCLGIKGLTAGPGLAFYNSSNTLLSKLVGTANQFQRVSGNNIYNILDNSTTHINDNTITINGSSLTVSKSDHNHDGRYLKWLGNAGQSNMNAIGRISHSSGMTNLSDPGNTIDNPMEGGSKSTSWHLYWQTNYSDDPSGSNAWVAQIVNKAGTDRWWVRSRDGGTITNGTNWTSNWRFLVTAPTSGLGSANQPVYINSAGEVVLANNYPTSLKSPYSLTLKANGTILATYDGSSSKEANFTYANVGAASASHTHTYIVAEDHRAKYPGQILDPQRMKLSFLLASTLGIKNDGSYYDVITVRSYMDSTGGSDNALLFSKNTNSLYHTRFEFGSTSSWGSPLLIIDSGNIRFQSVAYATNADTLDNYHANGLLTALSNSNRGISLTVGGTTKSLSNISVGDADTVDRYHANTIYNAPSFIVSNDNTSNTYILLATITISGTSLSCAEFTTLFQNRECLDNSSFILSGAIRRDSPSNVRATLSYVTLHTGTPRNIYLRSDDGVTFRVYIQSAAGSWTTYYRAIPIVDSGNITYSNTGTTSPISGSVLNIAATKGGNVNYASSAGSADTATKLTSSAGNAALPIYFSDGKPVACTASSVFSNLSNSGNNLSITVAGQNRTLTVGYATSAGSATKVIVNQHTNNDINYPLVWSNQNNANNATENQLFKSWQDLYYNPKNKRLFVKGSVSTANINATGTVTSAGFKHSSVTENADQYVLTADGGYTFLNQTSNELAHEFSKDITVTSEWADIEDFYGGNQNFLTQPGTYIVQVYYNDSSADGMYEGYFSGIMSWFTKTTNSNNADEIVLHRVGHAYANTIYLRTRESLESETNPYTKLQISANTTLKQHTYKFKFKKIC